MRVRSATFSRVQHHRPFFISAHVQPVEYGTAPRYHTWRFCDQSLSCLRRLDTAANAYHSLEEYGPFALKRTKVL